MGERMQDAISMFQRERRYARWQKESSAATSVIFTRERPRWWLITITLLSGTESFPSSRR